MLINITNHPSSAWGEKQKNEAETNFGQIIDLPFPNISPTASNEELDEIAVVIVDRAKDLHDLEYGITAHVMGEMTFVFKLVKVLNLHGIRCVASTTQRNTTEKDGVKTSIFEFVQFREYK